MLRKFTKADVDAVADAFDKYGFEEVQYVPTEDIMYLVFQTKRNDINEMMEAVKYLKDRIPYYNWSYDRHGQFYHRMGSKRGHMFIVSCYGWGEDVIE